MRQFTHQHVNVLRHPSITSCGKTTIRFPMYSELLLSKSDPSKAALNVCFARLPVCRQFYEHGLGVEFVGYSSRLQCVDISPSEVVDSFISLELNGFLLTTVRNQFQITGIVFYCVPLSSLRVNFRS